MSWKEKLDSYWKGFVIGMLFPIFCFFCYWLFKYSYMEFPVKFVKYLMFGQMLSGVIKVCALGNLLIFYLFLNKHMNSAVKGIITSVFIYVALVFYVMYYHEQAF
ncbi:MAG TPA: hypothetical protein VN026_14390 [Bacteroidia bacterium]|jgi:hypothetical protein|nr:hypothetical protein [Bacteroidia bacterium]